MPSASGPWRLALIVALAVLLGGSSLGLLTGHAAPIGPSRLQLVVEPHPDDLLEAAAALQDDPSMFTLFITMTLGEQTRHCARAEAEVRYGELAPRPHPTGRGTPTCRAARLHSWISFLRAAAPVDPGIPPLTGHQRVLRLGPAGTPPSPARSPTLASRLAGDAGSAVFTGGSRAAAIAFDTGDGDITTQEVRRAVHAALALRGSLVPDLPLDQVVAAAYWNDSPQHGQHTTGTGCTPQSCPGNPDVLEYEHPDHLAVIRGVSQVSPLARRGALLVTHPLDHRATDTFRIPPGRYRALLGLGPKMDATPESFRRLGVAQTHYGWLAFPRSYWVPGERAAAGSGVLFPRVQYFRRIR